MTEKTGVNIARVLLGGVVAGIIIFIINGIVNGGILNSDFEQWGREMGDRIHPPSQSISMSLWTVMCFIYGIVGVWIYACIRPRFGAGPKTALLAALFLWVVSKFSVVLDFIALGIFSDRIIAGQLIGSFVAIVLGIFLGARLYKE
ncbi:MAG: hypothetical protein M0R68_14280 [Bacteroidetes bacterium]|nr:hypothetical protein [Bacteroidota bacterium]